MFMLSNLTFDKNRIFKFDAVKFRNTIDGTCIKFVYFRQFERYLFWIKFNLFALWNQIGCEHKTNLQHTTQKSQRTKENRAIKQIKFDCLVFYPDSGF